MDSHWDDVAKEMLNLLSGDPRHQQRLLSRGYEVLRDVLKGTRFEMMEAREFSGVVVTAKRMRLVTPQTVSSETPQQESVLIRMMDQIDQSLRVISAHGERTDRLLVKLESLRREGYVAA